MDRRGIDSVVASNNGNLLSTHNQLQRREDLALLFHLLGILNLPRSDAKRRDLRLLALRLLLHERGRLAQLRQTAFPDLVPAPPDLRLRSHRREHTRVGHQATDHGRKALQNPLHGRDWWRSALPALTHLRREVTRYLCSQGVAARCPHHGLAAGGFSVQHRGWTYHLQYHSQLLTQVVDPLLPPCHRRDIIIILHRGMHDLCTTY